VKLDLTSILEGDPVLYYADDSSIQRLDRASLTPTLVMKSNVSLLTGRYAQRGNAIVRLDFAKKKIETITAIDQRAPMALFEGALFLFQGSEGLTHHEQTAGALRIDPKTKTFERVLDVVDKTFVGAGACASGGT
jgi:hypothetical protein